MQQAKPNKKLIIALSILLVLVIAVVSVYFLTRPETTTGVKTITVEVVPLDGSAKTHTLNTDAEFLADALLEANLAEGTDGELGFFITAVDGIAADDSLQQWWSLSVGGDFAEVGASKMAISDGDKYELTLMEGY